MARDIRRGSQAIERKGSVTHRMPMLSMKNALRTGLFDPLKPLAQC